MGNLVFQATLGGQVNLVGPNTASTFNINVPAVAGTLVTTGDTGTVTNTMLASSAYTAPGTIGSGTPNTGAFTTLSGSTSVTTPIVKSAGSLLLQTNGTTTAVTVDTAQNVGVGVTPSAWNTNYKVVEIGKGGSSVFTGISSGNILTASNVYLNSSDAFTYKNNGYAAYSAVRNTDASLFTWNIAASGTAGNAISFTQAMTLDSSGNLLVASTNSSTSSGSGIKFNADGKIGVVATSAALGDTYNYYNSTAGAYRFYVNNAGTIFATSTTISAISDQRLKENVRDLEFGLSELMALKPRRFDWKEGKGQDKKNAAGFIAQEFETVFPDSVGTSKAGEDGVEYKNINHEELIPTLVKAIQEQQALITQLQADVAALKAA